MIEWLTEPFETTFMQRALVAGVLVGLTTAAIGTWVVLRGLAFMGDALAHGVLPGIALAFLWGFSTLVGALVGALVMVAGIHLVHRHSRLSDDVGIGLLFVGMLSVGVVIISRSPSFTTDLTAFLFGDILGVSASDLVAQGVAAALVVAGSAAAHRPFTALAFDRRKAEILGQRPQLFHFFMLSLVALAIVASFRVVGTLLVFGLLVGPPATAALFARGVTSMMASAAVLSAAVVVAGLVVSYWYDVAGAAAIAGLAVAGFFVALVLRALLEAGRRAPRPQAVRSSTTNE